MGPDVPLGVFLGHGWITSRPARPEAPPRLHAIGSDILSLDGESKVEWCWIPLNSNIHIGGHRLQQDAVNISVAHWHQVLFLRLMEAPLRFPSQVAEDWNQSVILSARDSPSDQVISRLCCVDYILSTFSPAVLWH